MSDADYNESSSCDTSAEDKGDAASVCPRRDLMTDGIFALLKPTVDRIDKRIKNTRYVTYLRNCSVFLIQYLIRVDD